jgi:hypothetical protein
MRASLNNETVTVIEGRVILTLVYPNKLLANNAYSFIWECCERFTKENSLAPDNRKPKIYVFGELYKPLQFINRLAYNASIIGATANIVSED